MGVSYLLDTHAFVWLVQQGGPEVPGHVRAAITEADRLYVSAISSLEIATKVRVGNLPGAAPLVSAWASARRRIGATTLPMSEEHALLASGFEWDHRDPFDRILVAQAIVGDLTLITADQAVLAAPQVTTLAW